MKVKNKYQRMASIGMAVVLATAFALSSLATPQSAASLTGEEAKAQTQAPGTSGKAANATPEPTQADLLPATASDTDSTPVDPADKGQTVDEAAEQITTDHGTTDPAEPADAVTSPEEPMGTLTARGQVTINGTEAQTGATVMSGSTLSTGSDGDAIVDLGSGGRIQLRPNTSVNLVFSNKGTKISSQCGHTQVTVVRGKASVGGSAKDTLAEGQNRIVDGPVVLNEAANSEVVVGCTETPASAQTNTPSSGTGGGSVNAGKIGIFALVGASGVIAAAVATHGFQGSSSSSPQASPIQP